MLLTFEGVDGSGKTTQARLLYERLLGLGLKVFIAREPGGGALAERIRDLVLSIDDCSPQAELLLYNAARYEHFTRGIKRLIDAGFLVVCDRFIDSTVAYQGWGAGVDPKLIYQLHELLFGGFMPETTIFFDVPLAVALDRSEGKYEDKGVEFMSRVRDGYLDICANDTRDRIHRFDGTLNIGDIHNQVLDLIQKKMTAIGMRSGLEMQTAT